MTTSLKRRERKGIPEQQILSDPTTQRLRLKNLGEEKLKAQRRAHCREHRSERVRLYTRNLHSVRKRWCLDKKTILNLKKSPKKLVRNHGELSSISVSIIMEEKQIKNISKHSWSAHQAQITTLIHWRENETKDAVPVYQCLQLVRQYIHQNAVQDST